MTYDEKFSLIINNLLEAREMAREGYYCKLFLSEEPLSKIGAEIIHEFLLKLQDDEKIIIIKGIPTSLKAVTAIQPSEMLSPNSYFLIDYTDSFDGWISNFQIKEKGKIENLSEANFKEIYPVLAQLDDEMQISQSDKFYLGFISSIHDIKGFESEDIDELANGYLRVLDYLKKIGVLKDYTHGTMSLDAEVSLNVPIFLGVWERAKKINQSRNISTPAVQKEKVLAGYDSKRGLLTLGTHSIKLKRDSFRAKLIEILLKDGKSRQKEWSWDEIIETIEDTKGKEATKESKDKFYPACDGLSKFIAQKTGINDLLIYNKSTVQINSKYI